MGLQVAVGVLLLLASTANSQQAIGFSETDYEVRESFPEERMLEMVKNNPNNGNISVVITFLTFEAFMAQQLDMGAIDITNVDPAENSRNIQDFLALPENTVFQPSPDVDTFEFQPRILSDDIAELIEGYFAVAEFTYDDPQDEIAFNKTRDVALIRIRDDDIVTFGFAQESFMFGEEDGEQSIVFEKLDNSLTEVAVTVMLELVMGSSTAEAVDFNLGQDLPKNFTFLPSEDSSNIMFTPVDDSLLEADENLILSLTITLDGGVDAVTQTSSARVIILDNEVVVVGFSQTEITVPEDMGSFGVGLEVFSPPPELISTSFREAINTGTAEALFNIVAKSDSANDPDDYTTLLPSLGSVISGMNLDQLMVQPASITVMLVNDNVTEGNEQFTLNLESPSFQIDRNRVVRRPNISLIIIQDDDEPTPATIGFDRSEYQVVEGEGSVEICAAILEPNDLGLLDTGFQANFNFSTAQDSALDGDDFSGLTASVSLSPSSPRQCFNVSIIDDEVLELEEHFNAFLNPNGELPAEVTLGITEARVQINDNERGILGLRNETLLVNEFDGTVRVYVEFLSPDQISSDIVVEVMLSTQNDTAFGGSDYGRTEVTDTLQGSVNEVFFIDIPILNDDIVEIPNSEDFIVRIASSSPLVVGDRILIAPEEAIITIIDDDVLIPSLVGLEETMFTVDEMDGSVEVCAAILEPQDAMTLPDAYQVDFTISVESGTAIVDMDFSSLSGRISLTPTNPRECFSISITDDDIVEIPEEFTTMLELEGNLPPAAVLDDLQATVVINSNDDAQVGFADDNVSLLESDGPALLTVSLLNPTSSDVEVRVNFTTTDNTAFAGSDYMETEMSFLLQGGGGEMFEIEIPILDDDVIETPNRENFTANIVVSANVPLSLGPTVATVTIIDDDVLVDSVIGLEASLYEVGEGDQFAEVCAAILMPGDPSTLDSAFQANFNLSTSPGSAVGGGVDFSDVAPSFSFTPSEARRCFNISITDDSVLEVTEFFTVSLVQNGELPPGTSLDITSANVQIADNEMGRIAILNASSPVLENVGSATIYVGFEEPDEVSEDIAVNITFSTADNTARSGVDYESTETMFTLRGGGREIFRVSVEIMNDTIAETPTSENFQIQIEATDPEVLPASITLNSTPGLVIIVDDDQITTSIIRSPSLRPSPTVDPPESPRVDPSQTSPPGNGIGGDPHYSIMLPSGKLLCFSVHGEKDFPFNLISNDLLQMNAFFIEDALRDEITWIGSLGVVVQHAHYKKSNTTKIRFEAKDQMIYINNGVSLHARKVEKLSLANGKLTVSEALRRRSDKKPEVQVDLVDVGLTFSVRFVKKRHLDMSWKNVDTQPADSHGLIGQFLRKGVEIDETRKLLYLPSLAPVPVMRSSVWHFMERESPDQEQQLCWQAMNPGYQGKKLIEGSYLDYLVDDVLTSDFQFKPTSKEY